MIHDYTKPRRCKIVKYESHPSGGSLTVYAPDPSGTVMRAQVEEGVPFHEVSFDESGNIVVTRLDPKTGLALH